MYHGLKSQINLRFCEGKPAAERMGRPPLRNTGIFKKVESAVSNDRRHTVCYLADLRGLGKPMSHRILKSDLILPKASARWVPRLLLVDDYERNLASYNCENCPTSFII